ncbi:MAG TPA: helix-turn-helix transcriptional regulator [Polyangia bacterium]
MTRGSDRKRSHTSKGFATGRHVDDGPTHIDGPKGAQAARAEPEPEALPPAFAEAELELDELLEDEPDSPQGDGDGDDEDGFDERTINRGSRPPRPSSSRRLSPTLMKIFQRRREQIGLSVQQVARLAGVEESELVRFEGTAGQHRLVYDHAVVIARVLGLKAADLPGLRPSKERGEIERHLGEVSRALLAGPLCTMTGGADGERYGGDLERIAAAPSFAVRLEDSSLGEGWPKGALLGFTNEGEPGRGEVVLLRHRSSRLLALRRLKPPNAVGLAAWQPSYVVGGEWLVVGRLQVILPRAP